MEIHVRAEFLSQLRWAQSKIITEMKILGCNKVAQHKIPINKRRLIQLLVMPQPSIAMLSGTDGILSFLYRLQQC